MCSVLKLNIHTRSFLILLFFLRLVKKRWSKDERSTCQTTPCLTIWIVSLLYKGEHNCWNKDVGKQDKRYYKKPLDKLYRCKKMTCMIVLVVIFASYLQMCWLDSFKLYQQRMRGWSFNSWETSFKK